MSSPSDSTHGGSAPVDSRPAGVIHDLGYRPYTGPRIGAGPVAWSFFRTGLRNTYGLGRSGRSKVLPMMLLAMMLLPALILVGVLVQAQDVLDLHQQLVAYSRYPVITQALISVFVAAQAPALISRDLRFRTITLYLARPMPRSVYVLVRYASLTVATFILIGAPLVLMYAGGLLADLPVADETRDFLGGIFGAALLAALLSGLAAVVAALTVRRGLAVAAVIVVLAVTYVAVVTVQGIATATDSDRVGQIAGLFSPYTLVNGVQVFLFDAPRATVAPPEGTAMGLAYVLVALLIVAGSVGALLARYRTVQP